METSSTQILGGDKEPKTWERENERDRDRDRERQKEMGSIF